MSVFLTWYIWRGGNKIQLWRGKYTIFCFIRFSWKEALFLKWFKALMLLKVIGSARLLIMQMNNAVMNLLVFKNLPKLCLFSSRDISEGEEIRYNYGEENLPWREVIYNFLFYKVFLKRNIVLKMNLPVSLSC